MTQQFSPNQQQQTAISWRGGHALVLAGAGTGKTFTVVERTRGLIADGVEPSRIALLTFTRRAAEEMRSRVGTQHRGIFAGTLHSWAIKLMYSRSDVPIRPDEWTIIDRDDQLQLMRRIKTRLTPEGASRRYPKPAQVLSFTSYARSTLITIEEYLDLFTDLEGEQCQFVIEAAEQYRQYKQRRRYLDFDDILEVIATSLTENTTLAERIATQYDEVLIDEGQDLNPLQWKIIDSLVPYTRIFMVGDDGQSIYRFRGADFDSIHAFKSRVPDATILKLEKNYRSGQGILNLANWVLDQSPLQYQKQLYGTRGTGEKPLMRHFGSDIDEADWLTNTILDAHNNGDPFSSNLILMRTMSGARQIEASLVEKSIPYVVIGGQGLFALAHTKDLLAAVRATVSPRDELAWLRYLLLFPGIGDIRADRVVERLLQCTSIMEARAVVEQELPDRAREVLAPISAIGRHQTQPGEALRQAKDAMLPLFEHKYREDWNRRCPDIDLMVSLAESRSDVVDFIEVYTLNPIHGTEVRSAKTDDSVTLITVHSAKGTEGRRVFVPQAQYGTYPSHRAMGSEAEIEEERRILYVALTRAEDELLLSNGRSGYAGFQTRGDASAFFLEKAPDSLMDHVGVAPPAHNDPLALAALSDWG